jgi:arylsulfatase
MSPGQPNVALVMTDQHRGDCLGIDGHAVLQTPHLDHLGASGVRFTRAYSACPVCVPARRTLMTGQRPVTHGLLMNGWTPLTAPTLPEVLSRAGYQTHLVGKLHFNPPRARYGFQSMDWSDGPWAGDRARPDDYQRFLAANGVPYEEVDAHGVNVNGWTVRPWHLPERLHHVNWCVTKAIEFLDRRDPTTPFFLNVSFLHPHQPLTPPAVYYDRYQDMDIPQPYVGDWARTFDGPRRGLPIASWRTALEPAVMKQYRAAYYASINHIDDQLARLFHHLPGNTVIVFCADHGEMLGDHQWIRKRIPYEGSARVPLLMKFPDPMKLPEQQVIDAPVELMDVMPTLLDAVGVDAPGSCDGQSLLPLLRGAPLEREYVHGECSEVPTADSGMQYLTDGHRKYIWWPGAGREQFFDLDSDPTEMNDLVGDPACASEIVRWRSRLVRELSGRPEGFTDGRELIVLNGPTAPVVPPGWSPTRGPWDVAMTGNI